MELKFRYRIFEITIYFFYFCIIFMGMYNLCNFFFFYLKNQLILISKELAMGQKFCSTVFYFMMLRRERYKFRNL